MAYIRKDWLDELGMEMPTTKEELGEYLYAVKEKNLGGSTTTVSYTHLDVYKRQAGYPRLWETCGMPR